MDPSATRVRNGPLKDFMRSQMQQGELGSWLVGVMGLNRPNAELGTINLDIVGIPAVNLIERTKLRGQNTFKAITSKEDQEIGLTDEQKDEARNKVATGHYRSYPQALRSVRDPGEGVLLIYPISRFSGSRTTFSPNSQREALFTNPEEGADVIGVALIFPESESPATVEYVVGTVGVGD